MNNCTICSVYSGPGGGKTTTAAHLFSQLKSLHYDVEYVNEFAKECILSKNNTAIKNQIYLFATQLYRIECASLHSQFVITDSPLLLNVVYNQFTTESDYLKDLVVEQYRKFNNVDIILKRGSNHEHSMIGRIHGLTESISLDRQIESIVKESSDKYIMFDAFNSDIKELIEYVIVRANQFGSIQL